MASSLFEPVALGPASVANENIKTEPIPRIPQNNQTKRHMALVVDDDSPVLQDCLRRGQNANPWIRFGRLSVSQVYPSRFRSARNFCSPQIGSTIALRAGYTAGNLHLRGQTLLF